jgi:hypothetical protein
MLMSVLLYSRNSTVARCFRTPSHEQEQMARDNMAEVSAKAETSLIDDSPNKLSPTIHLGALALLNNWRKQGFIQS